MIQNLEELLLTVRKPARYTGGEWNSVKKEWTSDRVKFLLAFPDAYEVGMSYLGMKVLYGILNGRDDCACERVFSPWPDFEEVLRKNKIELFSLESRRPIKEFDIIGFHLTYELSYTNTLNILDLGGIPKFSSERTDADPVIIAGGPACYNPEPMSDFIDAFVIGDGEDVVGKIVDAYKRGPTRADMLKELSKIEGVYVPSFYEVEYNADGTIRNFLPKTKDVPKKIKKAYVKDLDAAFYPTKQIVPYIQIVHDRIAIEIMRGCKHACKYCQASATYRPYRLRSMKKILELAMESYRNTGYDEVSLLSLSSGDHPDIVRIVAELNDLFKNKSVSISVPSLRVEDVLSKLPTLLSKVKKGGLTFAPEAARECLRKVINKNIEIEKLLKAAAESYRAGWRRVKLYFMIGLPSEEESDVLEIADLVKKISDLKKEVDSHPAQVAVSVNAFIPKPHTLFEREGMADTNTILEKQGLLKSRIRRGLLELSFHPLWMSYVEAIFSRGDRRLGRVIYGSWAAGSRFDGWDEFFNFGLWEKAFRECGLDPHFYANRVRNPQEIMPWGFVEI